MGIAASQTGIYPLNSPGGWQLLGMTPVKTYDPERETPILVEAGDYIRFVPVTEEEFLNIKNRWTMEHMSMSFTGKESSHGR